MSNLPIKKPAREAQSGKFYRGYRVVGTTRDGVRILKPPGKPTHFTLKELREAIAAVREAQAAAQVAG